MAVEIEYVKVLSINLDYDDIDNFLAIMDKLLHAVKQAGFNKTFTTDEISTIYNIAEGLGLDKPSESNVTAEKYTVE